MRATVSPAYSGPERAARGSPRSSESGCRAPRPRRRRRGLGERRRRRRCRRRGAAGSRPAARRVPAAAARARGWSPRTWLPASTPWTITPSAPAARAACASSTDPHWCSHGFSARLRGLPQKVTITSACPAASQWLARAKLSRRFTAIGFAVARFAFASSLASAGAGMMPIVPRPPASDTAAASSLPATPPPSPACTMGSSTPRPLEQRGRHPTGAGSSKRSRRRSSSSDCSSIRTKRMAKAITSTIDCSTIMIAPPRF
jgi:hypothetical protein